LTFSLVVLVALTSPRVAGASAVAGAKKLGHLNPQTQETSFPFKGRGR